MNIIVIENGFIINESTYLFEGGIEVISENKCWAYTNKGIILLDLSCTINEVKFTDINKLITALKG